MKKYNAVDCSFHDIIEEAIIRRTKGAISYIDEQEQQAYKVEISVKDWVNRNKEEFVILSDQTEIRMDRITHFLGKDVVDGRCTF